jgi:NAD(P)-dependent dehydrogenase (short-subunit alcohol dehydrogenase family)
VRDAVASVAERWGRVDILFSNAGVNSAGGPIDELDEAAWDRILAVHLKGYFLTTKHVVPWMKRQGAGAIVSTSSTTGLVGFPGVHAYGAAKHGIVGLTKALALELAPFGIRVNSVAPGAIDTRLIRRGAPALTKAQLAWIVPGHPLGRAGEAEDVAHAVLYLVSDDAKFVTGVVLPVDGGYTAR